MAKMFGRPVPPEEVVAAAFEAAKKELSTFEAILAKHDGDFIVNNEPTIADLQLFYEFTDVIPTKIPFDEYPEINKWYGKMLEIPEVKAIQEGWGQLLAAIAAATAQKS